MEVLRKRYNELIYNRLVEEQVEKIVCTRDFGDDRFFDDLYVDKEKGTMIVHRGCLKHDFEGFNFDFPIDYSDCLAQIERGLFYANRRNNNAVGLDFTFSKEKQDYLNDDDNFISLA